MQVFYFMIGIYKIVSPTKKIYIGQSIDIEKRFIIYKNLNCKSQKRLYHSFNKHGVSSHVFSVIEECEVFELNDKERYYQEIYCATGIKGMNCMLTKSNDRSGKHSDKTLLKFREVRKNISKETRKKQSIAQLGRKHSDETKLKMSKSALGVVFSLETINRMSVSAKKRGYSEKNREANSKIVLDFSTGVYYNSCVDASNCLKIKYSALKAMLSGQNNNRTNLKYV